MTSMLAFHKRVCR